MWALDIPSKTASERVGVARSRRCMVLPITCTEGRFRVLQPDFGSDYTQDSYDIV